MHRGAGNAEGVTGGDGTQCRDSLDGGVHKHLSSLLIAAREIPNNDETFF